MPVKNRFSDLSPSGKSRSIAAGGEIVQGILLVLSACRVSAESRCEE